MGSARLTAPSAIDEPLVRDLERSVLRLDRHGAALLVERRCAAQQQLGARAHHPQRHDDVARLERAGGGFGQERREEHEVLRADDRRLDPALAEQPRHPAAGEAAAEDQRAATGSACSLIASVSSAVVAIDGAGTGNARPRRLWVAFVDPLPNRVFFDCGIVAGLRHAFDERITALFPLHPKHIDPWRDQLDGLRVVEAAELMPLQVPLGPRIVRRADIFLDDHVGFHTLAVRTSLRHGFNKERWAHGHPIAFLDIDRAGHLPRWDVVDRAMSAWLFSGRRYVPGPLLDAMRADCEGLVVTNLQAHVSMPYLVAARRLGVPVVGYVASWDHTVGKGVVSPHLDLYVVQNEIMRSDLVRYHGIDPARITITGWPQTDVYHRRRSAGGLRGAPAALRPRPGEAARALRRQHAGQRAVRGTGSSSACSRGGSKTAAHERFSLLFRPHPRDNRVAERFGAAAGVPGAAVQAPSYTDLEDLATLLQHADVVVANAGTILLDALVNDRPAVCVLWDEGAPAGERWADRNLVGDHYKQLAESAAFLRAHDFDELLAGIDRALSQPGELAAEREQIAREVVGEVDGKAGERVVEAIVSRLG